jgi:hypothetical protein
MGEYKRALYDFSAAIFAETGHAKEQNIEPTTKDTSIPWDQQRDKYARIAMCYNFAGKCNNSLLQYQEAINHYNIAAKYMALQLEAGDKNPTDAIKELEAEILFNRG